MLLSLHIKNGYRHADSTFTFGKGLTSITGPNESGKSVILEMIRYSLWGSAALRGVAADYKKLEVTLGFKVKGDEYKVYRGRSKDRLQRLDGDKWTDLAIGATPVSNEVKRLFGYDMLVFDVANSCNQGAIEALGNMKPAERKKMVDQTIGLQFIDGIIDWAGTEAVALKREAEATERAAASPPSPPVDPQLVAPVEVVLPPDFKDPSFYRSEIAKLQAGKQERDQLVGALQHVPTAPTKPSVENLPTENEDQLRALISERDRVSSSIRTINAELSRIVPAPYTEVQLVAMENQIKGHASWCQKKQLLDKGSLSCPSCKHTWPIMSDALVGLDDVVEVAAPAKGVTLTAIAEWRRVLSQQGRKATLEGELHEAQFKLASLPDRSDDLRRVQQHGADVRAYNTQLASYQSQVSARQAKEQKLATITTDFDAEISRLQGSSEAAVRLQSERSAYETALNVYKRSLTAYEQAKAAHVEAIKKHEALVAEAAEKGEAAEGMSLGRDALKDLKVRIKKFLVPSLNKVASSLIADMTGGKRSQIVVDEDFNIKVDGQDLMTLSGSGKHVANLAIRIALGQVLTNRVFSVFMADEIDQAMDAERAGFTAECLRALSKEIDQVVLISHKKPSADHYIELVS